MHGKGALGRTSSRSVVKRYACLLAPISSSEALARDRKGTSDYGEHVREEAVVAWVECSQVGVGALGGVSGEMLSAAHGLARLVLCDPHAWLRGAKDEEQ